MRMDIILIVIWVLFPVTIMLLLFGMRYLKNKENMAMIERNQKIDTRTNTENTLVWGLVLIGGAVGIIVATTLMQNILTKTEPIIVYLACISFFVGAGLLIAYNINRKRKDI